MRRLMLAVLIFGASVLVLVHPASASDGGDDAANVCNWRCDGIAKILPNGDIECDGTLTATNCNVTQTDAGVVVVNHDSNLNARCSVSPIGPGLRR